MATQLRNHGCDQRPCRFATNRQDPPRHRPAGVSKPERSRPGLGPRARRRHGADLAQERNHVEVVVHLADLVVLELDDHHEQMPMADAVRFANGREVLLQSLNAGVSATLAERDLGEILGLNSAPELVDA